MVVLIDNYDSFVHNLARYLQRLGQETCVVRNDHVTVDQLAAERPAAIVLSPGPCTPAEAGCSVEVVRRLGCGGRPAERVPILGVCLGHQAIAVAMGGRVVRAPEPIHGRTSSIVHDGQGVFAGLASPLNVCRYHSLVVQRESLPETLIPTAETADGIVMAIRHRSLPIEGVQFHPESILTDDGYAMLANFIERAGLPVTRPWPAIDDELELVERPRDEPDPGFPITF